MPPRFVGSVQKFDFVLFCSVKKMRKYKYPGVAWSDICGWLLYIWLRKWVIIEVLFRSCSDLIIFGVECIVFVNM